MNWKNMRLFPWLDTRAYYVSKAPKGGRLLDVATSNGETLRHFAELRPDLQFYAVDMHPVDAGCLPAGTRFEECDVMQQDLPVESCSLDIVTAMHLVEHLADTSRLFGELKRVIKPGGLLYLEYPHAKTLNLPPAPKDASGRALYTMNFYDDTTHVKLPDTDRLMQAFEHLGFLRLSSGISRNLIFVFAYLFYYQYAGSGRPKYTAMAHHLGWSQYVCLRKK